MKTRASPRACTYFLLYACVSIRIFWQKLVHLHYISVVEQSPVAVTVTVTVTGGWKHHPLSLDAYPNLDIMLTYEACYFTYL